MNLEPGVDEGGPSPLGVFDQDVEDTLAVADVAARPIDVDSGATEGVARPQERPRLVDKPNGDVGRHPDLLGSARRHDRPLAWRVALAHERARLTVEGLVDRV